MGKEIAQTASLGGASPVAASPGGSSAVEPGYGVRGAVPVAPVPGVPSKDHGTPDYPTSPVSPLTTSTAVQVGSLPPSLSSSLAEQGATFPESSDVQSSGKEDEKPKTPALLVEPDMSGKWSNEKCVQYAEWCNDKRYTDKMREEQLKAAQAIHKNDKDLTLEQFKQAYDERNDEWWQEHKRKLHVNDMKAKGKSGIDRVHEMLQHIEDRATRGKRHLRIVSTNSQDNGKEDKYTAFIRRKAAESAAACAEM